VPCFYFILEKKII